MTQRQIENTIPVLAVSDLPRSVEFYARVLGFEVEWSTPTICSVARDRCSIMLEAREHAAPADPDGNVIWLGAEPGQ